MNGTTTDAGGDSSTPLDQPVLVSAVEQALADGDDAAFFEARDAERRGTPLTPKTAGSAPAKPAAQAASTDASSTSASETDKTPDGKEGKGLAGRTAKLKTEVQELEDTLRRRRELRQELQALEKGGTTADTPAATPEPTSDDDLEAFAKLPGAPKEEDFTDYNRYVLALARFAARTESEQVVSKALQQHEAHKQSRAVLDSAVEQGRKAYDDFDDVIARAAALVEADPALALPDHVRRAIASMPDGWKAGYALAQKIDDVAFRARLADPVLAGMAIAELLQSSTSPVASSQASHSDISNAPPPPFTLGKRPAVALDAEDAALAARDDAAWFRARDAKEAAARR